MVKCMYRYTPVELRRLPFNTVLNERRDEPVQDDVVIDQTDHTAAAAADSVAEHDDKNVQVEF